MESVNEVTAEYQVKLLLGVTLLNVTIPLVRGQVGQPSPALFTLHHLYETFRVVVRFNLREIPIRYNGQCENEKPSGNIYKVPEQSLQVHSQRPGQSPALLQKF